MGSTGLSSDILSLLRADRFHFIHSYPREFQHQAITSRLGSIRINLLYALIIHNFRRPTGVYRGNQELDLLSSQMTSDAHAAARTKSPEPAVHLLQLFLGGVSRQPAGGIERVGLRKYVLVPMECIRHSGDTNAAGDVGVRAQSAPARNMW